MAVVSSYREGWGLFHLTNAISIVNFYLTGCFWYRNNIGRLWQVFMTLMNWATNVLQRLLQSDANLEKKRANHIKEVNLKDWCLKFGTMKKEFRVIVDK
jgi:hypothetical protein